MLVLTRKLQEQIKIGDNITVTVLRTKGGAVRIGVEAPRHVRILRGELPRHDEAAADTDGREDQGGQEPQTAQTRGCASGEKVHMESGEETDETSVLPEHQLAG